LGSLAPGPLGSGFGNAVATVGDQNGDGQEDILVGAPFSTGNGQAFLFSGSRSAGFPLLATFNPAPSNVTVASTGFTNTAMAFGWSVSRLDNLNGTGSQEFAIGAPQWQPVPFGFGSDRIGLVEIHSNPSFGVPLKTLFGSTHLEEFGYSITTLRKLGGVTTATPADFAVGSPSPQNLSDAGAVSVFSGLILSLTQPQALISFFAYQPQAPSRFDMGTCLASTDANGDNHDDVLTGMPDVANISQIRSAYVRYGAGFTSGQVVGTTVTPPMLPLNTGWSVSECGAFDANAGDEILAGAPDASGSPMAVAGHAFILSTWTPAPVHDILAPNDVLPNGDPSFGRVVSEIDTSLRWFAVAAPATNRVYIYH